MVLTNPLYLQSQQDASALVLATLPSSAYNCLLIDLKAIVKNYQFLASKAPEAHCACVVKGDAYGAGVVPTVKALFAAGCTIFFVAYLDEGIEVRQALGESPTIYVLNGFLPGCEAEFLHYNLTPVLTDIDQIHRWRSQAVALATELPAAIHVDTGMKRTGLPSKDLQALIDNPQALVGISVKLVMSHLACASLHEDTFNSEQRQRFLQIRQLLPLAPASLANSSGIFLGSNYHFNVVRPGIALYGTNPTPHLPNPMSAVMGLWAKIYQVQDVQPGETVGYRQLYVAKKPRRIATLTIGYADGVPLLLSNQGMVNIGGYQAPLIGRVSMDLLMVDVSEVPEQLLYSGQWVEFLGSQAMHPDQWAALSQTLGQEILTKLGKRLKRVYSA